MRNRMIFGKLIGVFFFLFLLSGYISAKDKVLKLMVGESRVINVAYSIKKIAIGNPLVADVTMVSKKEILVFKIYSTAKTLFTYPLIRS